MWLDSSHSSYHHDDWSSFAGDKAITTTGAVVSKVSPGSSSATGSVNSFKQYSWAVGSDFQKLMKELWRYIQSFEDEHYQIYYKRNINEETLKDYSSAIQEIIPRMVKVQSILNHNSRGFPDMMRWTAPSNVPLNMKETVREGGQDCQEFAIFAKNAANQTGPVSNMSSGSLIQSALACQAAASKAAVALQREKFGDPVCDPKTVIASSNGMNSLLAVVSTETAKRKSVASSFLS